MRCVIICASPCVEYEFIKSEIKSDDYVICADNGFKIAQELGIKVDMVIGDFDSYNGVIPQIINTKVLPKKKDDTDTFYSVKTAIDMGFKDIVLLNAMGGRTDHTIANISVLKYIKSNKCNAAILSQNEEMYILSVGTYLYSYIGRTFSLFPFGCESVTISYAGTQYDTEKLKISADFPIGISNVFTDEKAVINVFQGTALLIINKHI